MDWDELRTEVADLRESRRRLVAAVDAERRWIERQLHDGAQQHIVALIVDLQLARQLVDSDPTAATALLDEIAGDAKRALENVRELAHGIYPPLLMDRGLVEAVGAAVASAGIPARFEAEGLDRHFPQEVEETVYFCILAALRNASEHAGDGAQVGVRLWQEAETMAFEVVDDGAGFDPLRTARGSGLADIADRLGAQGGRLSIQAEPGSGVRVTGKVPLSP